MIDILTKNNKKSQTFDQTKYYNVYIELFFLKKTWRNTSQFF